MQTLVAAARLRQRGHDVIFHDRMFRPDEQDFGRTLDRMGPLDAVAIVGDDHCVAMKQCLGRIRQAGQAMLADCVARGLPALISGPDVSDHPNRYLAAGADGAVSGEVQDVLLQWLDGDRDIAGLHGAQGAGGKRAPLDDLDALPAPAWDLVDLAPYRQAWRHSSGAWELNLWTARGCPYKCNWCAKPTWGRSYAVKSPTKVADELVQLMALGPDRLWFTDDIFALRRSWLRDFRAALDARLGDRPRLPYRCLSRVDLLEDPAFTADLAATGCREVWVGAESGSDDILRAMDKDCTVAQIRAATALLRQHGIAVGFFLQLGYPGETLDDVERTVEMIRQLAPDQIGVSVSYPLPGTPFHDRVAPHMTASNWQASMDNRPLYEAPYGEPFYSAAKRVIQHQHAVSRTPVAVRHLLQQRDRRAARRVAAALLHAASLPVSRWRMRRAAVPNPAAVPLTW